MQRNPRSAGPHPLRMNSRPRYVKVPEAAGRRMRLAVSAGQSGDDQVDAIGDKPETENKRAEDDGLVGVAVDPGSDFGEEDLALFCRKPA